MKKRLLGFFALLFVTVAYGQTIRYVYETSVNPDSINLVDLKNEKTFLDIKGNKSLFISESKLMKDSLQVAFFKSEEAKEANKSKKKEKEKDEKKFPKAGMKIEPTFFEYFITKNIAEKQVYYYDRVLNKQIYYKEDRPLNWEIMNVTEKQNGYNAQKAVVNFGGRIWTAWFTKDIPISDGPYKFNGLPGLIVKLEDDKGDYKFDLVKKITIQNAFEEEIRPDAKQSTRVEFNGDKAALELEFGKNKRSIAESSERGIKPSGGVGRPGGGMPGGGRRGRPSGGMDNEGTSLASGNFNNVSLNTGNQNPIELK
ncbi:GLPGLI family protein [Chryseobacterium sp.]|uniref:GLPGLI family protein n=1 Tax=Chryseobacterium sp. TaxID=1871047 RepID=UPI0025C1A25C|nr:GLPGLI family protein [Chryseobacterium sp.]